MKYSWQVGEKNKVMDYNFYIDKVAIILELLKQYVTLCASTFVQKKVKFVAIQHDIIPLITY